MKLNDRNLVPPGLLLYLCGVYLGNIAKIVSFILFVLMTVCFIRLRKNNGYAKHQALFWLFVSLSFIWAHKPQLNTTIAFLEIVTTFAFFYMAVILYQFTSGEEDVIFLMNIYLLSLGFLAVYLLVNTPTSYWGTFNIGMNLDIHKNDIGMNFTWGALMCFYLVGVKNANRCIYLVLFVACAAFSLIAGSRKALVVLLLGIAMYLVFHEKNVKSIRNMIIAVLVILIGYNLLLQVPALNELLGDRMTIMLRTLTKSSSVSISEDKSIWERSYYRGYAMQMFSESPISFVIGHGLDGFRTRMAEIGYDHVAYSHCNYTELLADYGLVGFLLYYYFKIHLAIKTFLLKNRKPITTFFLVILSLGIIAEYGIVSYYSNSFQFCMLLSFLGIVKTRNTEGDLLKI